ncbi:MAG: bifunctional nicotinamidase/pyrazinamidase [Bacteroidales bacterium]
MKALVIVDPQNDFMPGGALAVPDGDMIVPVINSIVGSFDLVVATQDWHPRGHRSFASGHDNKKPFSEITLKGLPQVLWPDHCVQGSQGAEFHPDLDTRPVEAIFRKGMNPEIDSYSGFYDNGHRVSTGLAGYMREKGVTEIYFCGLAADICVLYTIRDAVREGFGALLIDDAAYPLNSDTYSGIKEELTDIGVRIVQSSSLI